VLYLLIKKKHSNNIINYDAQYSVPSWLISIEINLQLNQQHGVCITIHMLVIVIAKIHLNLHYTYNSIVIYWLTKYVCFQQQQQQQQQSHMMLDYQNLIYMI